jgi:hypothetical protein
VRKAGWVVGGVVAAILLALASACAANDSPGSPSTSPRSSASPPSKAEVAAAIKQLLPPEQSADIKLFPTPGDEAGHATITVFKIEQDAQGRWRATAEIWPPMVMSYNPSRVVLVKDSGNWQIVSLKADRNPPHVDLSSDPSALPQ